MSGSIKNNAAAAAGLMRSAASIVKAPVSIMSACTALMGFMACDPASTQRSLAASLSVFILSAGSAALNNVQDRRIDAMMERTKGRPLPLGRVSPTAGALLSVILIAAGMAGLILNSLSSGAAVAGAAAVALYNGIYTPLKKRTRLAFIPGIICGVLPPLVGWLAAGGRMTAVRPWYLMALIGTWQVPHFWLILMYRGDDYRRNRIPTILDTIAKQSLRRLIGIWAIAFSSMILLMVPLLYMQNDVSVLITVSVAFIIPPVFFIVLAGSPRRAGYRFLFHFLNACAFIVTLTAVIN